MLRYKFCWVLICCWINKANCQQPFIDSSFAANGVLITNFANYGSTLNAHVVQPDDYVVFAGFTRTTFTTSDFALARCKPNGEMDSTFGTNGKVTTTIENRSEANSITLQNDGKIILGGNSNWFINLARYHSNGTLDSTFGTNGIVITDIEGYYSEKCASLKTVSNDKLLVCGSAKHMSNDNDYLLLIRYLNNGELDSTFGTNGVAIGPLGTYTSLAIQSDGNYLVGGSSGSQFTCVRYLTNGAIDSTYGNNGVFTHVFNGSAKVETMTVQNDDKIVLGGYSYVGQNNVFTLLRIDQDGSIDNSFGAAGITQTEIGTSFSKILGMVMLNNGKILVSGEANNGINNYNVAISQYHSNGELDQAFGTNGQLITSFNSSVSTGRSVVLLSDQSIIIGGSIGSGATNEMLLIKYLPSAQLGLSNSAEKQQCFFPNPFLQETSLIIDSETISEIVVLDVFGNVTKPEFQVEDGQLILHGTKLTSGTYIVVVTGTNGLKKHYKIECVKE